MEILIAILILLYSIVLHELAHGYVAEKLGDYTPKIAGRLTLNPLAHLDPIGSILLPILSIYFFGVGIGWAKPVPINPLNFENPKKDTVKVAIAGPLTNIFLALFFLFLYKFFVIQNLTDIANLMILGIRINLILAVFNLIPIPPLDGSKIFLQNIGTETMIFLEQFGFLLIFLLILMFPGIIFNIVDFLVNFLTSL